MAYKRNCIYEVLALTGLLHDATATAKLVRWFQQSSMFIVTYRKTGQNLVRIVSTCIRTEEID